MLTPPIIGLANNGDFEKVMGYAGLQYRETTFDAKYLRHVVRLFDAVKPGWYRSGYLSSETLLALGARKLPGAVSTNVFDIRALGFLHAVLLVLALGLFVAACLDLTAPARWIAAGLLVVVFTDVGYAAPFNSFYSQSASLVFVLLTAAVAALAIRRGRLDAALLPTYFLCAALFVGSKPQEALQGPLLALLGLRLSGVGWRGWWRRGASWMAIGLCAFSLWYYRATPREAIHDVGLFHSVFLELLPHSPDPARDLADLGLEPGLAAYSGMNAYQPNSPVFNPGFRARFFAKFGYGDLVRFYVARPARLLDRLRRGAPSAFRLRPWRLGNYERASGFPPNTMTGSFAAWSDLRLKLAPHAVAALVVFFAVNAAACLIGYRRASPRARLARAGLAALLGMAVLEFLVCALADYLGDLDRHLYVFQALFDLVLIADVVWLTQTLATRSRPTPPTVLAET